MIDTKRGQYIFSILYVLFSTIGLLQILFGYNKFYEIQSSYLYAYTGILILSLIGFISIKAMSKKPNIFYVLRFFELHFIVLLIIMSSKSDITNIANIFMLSALFTLTTLIKGKGTPFIFLGLTVTNFLIDVTLCICLNIVNYFNIWMYLADLIIITIYSLYLNIVITSYGKSFWKLEEAHFETTKTNQLLNDTVAELSTLQEISKFSNSVLNIKELINLINDMIIGVIGVNYCSIFLIDGNTDKFYLEATNISDKDILQSIKTIIASKYLPQIKTSGMTIIEENINNLEDYPVPNDRNVKNSLITTLQSHRNFLGIILAESCFEGAFEERKKNMITTICNQVSIAIENAVIYDKMEKLATIDGLTQVHNRRYFNEIFLSEFSELKKNSAVSVAMMDIDNFKKINDTYGHLVGDVVLKVVATTIKDTVCTSDTDDCLVARYGGEEFVILFRNTELEAAKVMLEVVRKNIEAASIADDDQTVKFTISIGVAEYPHTSSDVKQILRDADNALYRAKETGKNKVVSADML